MGILILLVNKIIRNVNMSKNVIPFETDSNGIDGTWISNRALGVIIIINGNNNKTFLNELKLIIKNTIKIR